MTANKNVDKNVAAVVLAAGLSTRMGSAKMVLPWGQTTVIRRVVNVLSDAGVSDIWVVTGGARHQVEAALDGSVAHTVHNPDHMRDSMALSLQAGLANLSDEVGATLVALGDQPQIQGEVVRVVLNAYRQTGAQLVIPSFQMRRGHPWLVDRSLWAGLVALEPDQTLREFVSAHAGKIHYVQVGSDSILRDIDSPTDYQRERPPASDL